MKTPWLLLSVFMAPLAHAAETPSAGGAAPEPFTIRRIEFGVQGPEVDTTSSRFREYRDIPSGFVLDHLRFAGNEHFRYDVRIDRALQDDARYSVRAQPGPFQIDFDFQKIPHRFGNDGRALLVERPDGVFVMSDTLQRAHQAAIEAQRAANPAGVSFDFLRNLINPSIEAAPRIDLALLRERGRLELGFTPEGKPLDLRVAYFQERRHGNRAAGTSFGFGNVVETAEPIEFRTHDLAGTLEWRHSWGLVRGGVRYNWFENAHLFQAFDNPFRAADSTDPNAYQAPGSGSINGPLFGRVSLPAENQALTGTAGVAVKLPSRTRVTADASLSRWTQDSPFMPFSTNTAIRTPVVATDPAALPAHSLDGRIDVLSLSFHVSSRPVEKLWLTARYRHYDLDNGTPRLSFTQGYARFDAAWSAVPRINVPYGHTTGRGLLSASYDVGPVNVEAGLRHDTVERTFREVEETTEGTVFGALRWRPLDWILVRASAERASRDFDGEYHGAEAEHASFLEPGPMTNLPELRRFDLAKRDSDRVSAQAQLTPWGSATIGVSYWKTAEDYPESSHGLIEGDSESLSVDADYSPGERWNLHAFASRESFRTFQRGRQSGATPSTREIDDWTSDAADDVDTFGGGIGWRAVPDKVDVRVSASYQRVDGNNDLDSPPGGTPDIAVDIPEFDDTRLLTLGAELGYQVTTSIRLSLGGWYEDYELRDSATTNIATYLPGSIFLAANDADYRAHVVYARMAYAW